MCPGFAKNKNSGENSSRRHNRIAVQIIFVRILTQKVGKSIVRSEYAGRSQGAISLIYMPGRHYNTRREMTERSHPGAIFFSWWSLIPHNNYGPFPLSPALYPPPHFPSINPFSLFLTLLCDAFMFLLTEEIQQFLLFRTLLVHFLPVRLLRFATLRLFCTLIGPGILGSWLVGSDENFVPFVPFCPSQGQRWICDIVPQRDLRIQNICCLRSGTLWNASSFWKVVLSLLLSMLSPRWPESMGRETYAAF